jgi:metallo-beta-lactamase class B
MVALTGCAAAVPPSSEPFHPAPADPAAKIAACEGKDGWSDTAPPARIFANVYDVGTCGIVSLLITSEAGHILIDGATDDAAPGIIANIRALGFDPSDVRILLISHEHLDHVGGIAQLKQITGGRLIVRAEAKTAMETGLPGSGDPQAGANPPFPGAKVDGPIADGEQVTLGPLALTAHATPGHTPGSTSWTWRSCEGAVCHDMAYIDSLTPVSADGYRFTDHPGYVAAFRDTLDRIEAYACDLLITPHPGASNYFARLGGDAPLADPRACARYAQAARVRLDARLADETKR